MLRLQVKYLKCCLFKFMLMVHFHPRCPQTGFEKHSFVSHDLFFNMWPSVLGHMWHIVKSCVLFGCTSKLFNPSSQRELSIFWFYWFFSLFFLPLQTVLFQSVNPSLILRDTQVRWSSLSGDFLICFLSADLGFNVLWSAWS